MCETIRVLIADDHAIVREGLRALIATEPGMELVGEAADGEEALQLAHTLEPDVILLDLVMPHKDGIATIGELKAHKPDTRVLVLTSFADDAKVENGYLALTQRPGIGFEAQNALYAAMKALAA